MEPVVGYNYLAKEDDFVMTPISTGTTIVAVEYDDGTDSGVVFGADSRTTSGTYVSNRFTDKLTHVTQNIYCCRSGSAADTQAIADIVSYHLGLLEVQTGEAPRVRVAAKLFQELCYNNRDDLTAGIICAGWDRYEGGQCYTIPLGGMCMRQPVAMGGSGSTYVYGYVDQNYRKGMNKAQCMQFVANYVSLAMNRDNASGGVVRLAAINKAGIERVNLLDKQIPQHWQD
ncbi:proteasome subunit beta type-6-like [Paramacrobiotus metropolitanus]|uniref:proteasome subunit beta type-6-like n=1 Tax=Paramacrobiotus metropolitanus TaxID=2943436 RepID=UPI002445C12C|nr:proteasome subunit beta type-6-like [Paramacrobiotus metropolitanus]